MPGLTGSALVAQLFALRPDLPVILATGKSGAEVQERARALGIREILQKPRQRGTSPPLVARALARRGRRAATRGRCLRYWRVATAVVDRCVPSASKFFIVPEAERPPPSSLPRNSYTVPMPMRKNNTPSTISPVPRWAPW